MRLILKITLSLLPLLNSCGYHWGSMDSEKSIAIPYVYGDEDGSFSSELIHCFASGGSYVREGAPHRLEVAIVQTQNETISYRIAPQKIDGKVKKQIVGDQDRKIVTAEFSLFEGEKLVFGPHRVQASIDYDYYNGDSYQDLSFEYGGKRLTALAFSLGQLESSEAAQQAASLPLYKRLSKKIFDCVIPKL